MTTQQVFTNKELFTKQQYLAIKAAWKDAVKSDRVYPTLEEKEHWDYHQRSITPTMVVKTPGWIEAEHHLLYNLIRGKKPHTGFTLISSPARLDNGATLNEGYCHAARRLAFLVRDARKLQTNVRVPPFAEDQITKFLEPFNQTITIEDLAHINVPDYAAIVSNFAAGQYIARAIRDYGRGYVDDDVISMSREEQTRYGEEIKEELYADGT